MSYIVGAIITILLAVFVIPVVRDFYIEKTKPLELKPNKKIISVSKDGNNWNEEFFIYLVNHTKNPYYDINITSEYPKDININIFPENSDMVSLGSKENGISMGTNFVIAGENKEKGTKIVQAVINNIGPDEEKKMRVTIDKRNIDQNFELEFKISNPNKNPKPVFNK